MRNTRLQEGSVLVQTVSQTLKPKDLVRVRKIGVRRGRLDPTRLCAKKRIRVKHMRRVQGPRRASQQMTSKVDI